MANALWDLGRQGFLDGSIDWDSTGNIRAGLVRGYPVGTGLTSHTSYADLIASYTAPPGGAAFSTGTVTIGTVTNQNATLTGLNSTTGLVVGSLLTATAGTGSLGTTCVVTSIQSGTSVTVQSASGLTQGTVTAITTAAQIIGTPQTLSSKTVTGGVANAAGITFPSVSGIINTVYYPVQNIAIWQGTAAVPATTTTLATGTPTVGTVTSNTASITVTSTTNISIGSLVFATAGAGSLGTYAGIANCAVVTAFTANSSVTVQSTSGMTAGNLGGALTTQDVAYASQRLIAYIDQTTGVTLPVTPNGGDITIAWDTGANKIFKL